MPVSSAAESWIVAQSDAAAARSALAGFGDDYELLITAPPDAASALGLPIIGVVEAGSGVSVTLDGVPLVLGKTGWTHP
jgi:thiamine monophosphate kinase